MPAVLTNGLYVRGRFSSLDVGVAASVALHAVLLFAVAGAHPSLRWQEVAPSPLVARLVAVEPAAEPPKPEAKIEPPRRPAPPAKVSAPEPERAPVVAEQPRVVPEPAPVVMARSEPAASEEEPSASTAPVAAAATIEPRPAPLRAEPRGLALARPPEPPAPRIERPDPGTIAQYRGALISAARRYKVYPRVAIDNNWEGRVQVRMVIGAAGSIASMQVTASAGYQVLDAQALDMIRKAWPEAQLPANLRGREFAVDVPVIFSLRDPSA